MVYCGKTATFDGEFLLRYAGRNTAVLAQEYIQGAAWGLSQVLGRKRGQFASSWMIATYGSTGLGVFM